MILSFKGGGIKFSSRKGQKSNRGNLNHKGVGNGYNSRSQIQKNIFQCNFLRKIYNSMFRDLALKNLYCYFVEPPIEH